MAHHSTPKPIPPSMLTPAVLERFKTKYTVKDDGCWEWNYVPASQDGYGKLYIVHDGRRSGYRAHRLAYVIAHGKDVPTGMYLDHTCRNRACVNPDHLDVVTHRENVARGDAPSARTIRSIELTGHCPNGHDMSLPGAWTPRRGRHGYRACQGCRDDYYYRSRAAS